VRDGAADLESVAIAPAARRGGIGRSLCDAVIAWSRDQGAKVMAIEVRAANAGAIALYSSIGFTELARRTGYYQQPKDDAVVIRLSLM
jgi:ribosomal-protein-alanine N-acetyltransferase